MIGIVKRFCLFLIGCAGIMSAAAVSIAEFKTPGKSWDDALSAARKKHFSIQFPAGSYRFSRTIVVDADLTMQFADGVELHSTAAPVFRQHGGTLLLEASGRKARLYSPMQGILHSPPDQRNSLIDLNQTKNGRMPARLILKNLDLRGYIIVDAAIRTADKGNIALIDIDSCHFTGISKCIGIKVPEISECRIVNSLFEDASKAVSLDAAMPGGAYVCGNTIRNFGSLGLQIGKAGQVADGCTAHLPNAVIHDNRVLNGGQRSSLKDYYIHGILVYGNSISVQGNIVRDVNRGTPIPGRACGQQIIEPDGTVHRGRLMKSEGKMRRLAGSAIYLKANRALVQGNICTNSGWRSVIEIKTGGKEYYTSVVDNIVDGRALAGDDSYAFECHSGRSLWANNVVYDVPHQAFVVRSGFENTFINNVITNARIGFALSGKNPGQDELIAGNRFINVEYPVARDGRNLRAATARNVLLPSPARLEDDEELPAPGAQWHGRILVRKDAVFLGVRENDQYCWKELSGKLLPVPRYVPVGPELLCNADQSGREKIHTPALSSPLHPGWELTGMQTAGEQQIQPGKEHFSFDQGNTASGGRALKIRVADSSAQWRLRQPVQLIPGKRYRASAVVRGEEPRNLRLEVQLPERSTVVRAGESEGYQTLQADFRVPLSGGKGYFAIWSSKTSPGKAAWIDAVSLREIVPADSPEAQEKIPGPENLCPSVVASSGGLGENWFCSLPKDSIRVQAGSAGCIAVSRQTPKGNFMLLCKTQLSAGKQYRWECEWQAQRPAQVLASVRTAANLPTTRNWSRDGWNHSECDFSVPEKLKAVYPRIWIGGLKQNEKVLLRNIRLRALTVKQSLK